MHKVLIVDDEKKTLVLTKKFLEKQGYQIITSEDPIEALEIMKNHGPVAVILTDERMPNMRGTEFLKRVKIDFPNTFGILTTGQFDQESLERAIKDGEIFRFLKKPMSAEVARSAIMDAIAQYEERLQQLPHHHGEA